MERKTRLNLIFFFLIMMLLGPLVWAKQGTLTEQEALKLGTEAYIYGYPLVTMEITRQVMTNAAAPNGTNAPMGQFIYARRYPDANFKTVTAPNADTLYSVAWLDLSKEPYILHVPNEQDRYYLMPILSAWTDVVADLGTRTTGVQARNFAIVGPNWTGKLPADVTAIKVPTNMAWIIGRNYVNGTPEDLKAVHRIQDQYTLTPLSAYKKPYIPPHGTVNPNIDMKTPVRVQVDLMDAATYFKILAELMKNNPPATADAPMVAKLARLGIVSGQDFDISKLDPAVAKGLTQAALEGQKQIFAHRKAFHDVRNNWVFTPKTGRYGTDYLQRAFFTAIALGVNLPQDAVYPLAKTDNKGKTLNGAHQYIMHFEKGQTPPVKGFWSLTLYNDELFFAENRLNRYTLSPRNALQYNDDGSLDLYIQHDSPGPDKESNWLPAPEGEFILMLRLYWPEAAILNGAWKPPALKRRS